jgi:hypothetical protein
VSSGIKRIRRGYELKTLFFGRPIRPFHLAVTIATLVVAITNLTNSPDTFLLHASSNVLGAFALCSVVLLTIGWWFTNDWSAEWGLLLAVGVWVTRGVYIGITDDGLFVVGTVAAVVLSLAWAVGAGGAYILERYDHIISDEE